MLLFRVLNFAERISANAGKGTAQIPAKISFKRILSADSMHACRLIEPKIAGMLINQRTWARSKMY